MKFQESLDKNIADDFASALVKLRKDLKLQPGDLRICLIEPLGDVGLLNILCKCHNNIFDNRTSCTQCFIVPESDETFQDFSFSYFNDYVHFNASDRSVEWKGKIKLVKPEELVGLRIVKEIKNADSWSALLNHLTKSPVEWRDLILTDH